MRWSRCETNSVGYEFSTCRVHPSIVAHSRIELRAHRIPHVPRPAHLARLLPRVSHQPVVTPGGSSVAIDDVLPMPVSKTTIASHPVAADFVRVERGRVRGHDQRDG